MPARSSGVTTSKGRPPAASTWFGRMRPVPPALHIRSIEHVDQAAGLGIGKGGEEARLCAISKRAPACTARPGAGRSEGVDPERLHLDWLAGARG